MTAPTVWSDAVPPGGQVCAAPDFTHPDGICGMPVESEPCPEHNPADDLEAETAGWLGEQVTYWKGQTRERDAEIARLRAELAKAEAAQGRNYAAWRSARFRAQAHGEGIMRLCRDKDLWSKWAKANGNEVRRLRAGEADDPGDPDGWPTPGEWIRRWNDATATQRLAMAEAHIVLERAAWARARAAGVTIVVICGSTRFRDEIVRVNRDLTLAGKAVLAPGVFGHCGDPITGEEKTRLDDLHKQKIALAHEVVIVNPGGYIGESTRSEIAYATKLGKPISYLRTRLPDRSPARPATASLGGGALCFPAMPPGQRPASSPSSLPR